MDLFYFKPDGFWKQFPNGPPPKVEWYPLAIDIVHNGKTIRLNFPSADYIENQIFVTKQFYETELLEHIKEKYPVQKIIVDIGANIGNHAAFFENFIKNEQIVCFEPHPNNFKWLCSNIHSWNTVAYPLAVGNTEKQVKLVNPLLDSNIGTWSVSEDPNGISATMISLDYFAQSVGLGEITLIKIDAEGSEVNVLQGAKNVIQKDKPILFLEILGHLPADYMLKGWEYVLSFNQPLILYLDQIGYEMTDHFIWDTTLTCEFLPKF